MPSHTEDLAFFNEGGFVLQVTYLPDNGMNRMVTATATKAVRRGSIVSEVRDLSCGDDMERTVAHLRALVEEAPERWAPEELR